VGAAGGLGSNHALLVTDRVNGADNPMVMDDQSFVLARIIHRAQEVLDDVDPGGLLVVSVDHMPWCKDKGRLGEHLVPGPGIGLPVLLGQLVHRAQFPLLEGILFPGLQPFFLLFLRDIQVILAENDAGVGEHLLETFHLLHEHPMFAGGAELHHFFHSRPVVPAPVEEHDLLAPGQVRNKTLEIP